MESIGKYQIQKVLGRGGMGTVYEALDPHINRKVAVKTMIAGLAQNPDLRTRFLREAQAAGGLRHRNIVTVYDFGEDKGQPYIAMEFIEGTDLEKVIQAKEARGLAWKLDVLHQLCEGLAYAHKNGVVHRDVKPANVRVTPDGDVKIMDFGIAQLQSSSLTKGGLVLGTVHYMSPEQIEGHKVDHRADIFSVGAIAYELISGRRPFDGESLTAVMFRVMNETPDTKPIATEYSPGLDGVILKALHRDPNARYQNLDEMAADLESVLRQATPPASGDDRNARLARLLDEGQQLLAKGDAEPAVALAREALALVPTDAGARELLRVGEGEALSRRVEREVAEMKKEMQRARVEGQLQKALGLSRRLLELNPDDQDVVKAGSEIETAMRDREIEQMCSLALAYAADGDVELAKKIAGKIERLSPRSPRYLQLKKYLDEEGARRAADAFVSAAQEHLAQGNLEAALKAAEDALQTQPSHALAREIRERAGAFVAAKGGTRPAPAPDPAPAAPPAPPAPAPAPAVAAPRPAPPKPEAPKPPPPAVKVAEARPPEPPPKPAPPAPPPAPAPKVEAPKPVPAPAPAPPPVRPPAPPPAPPPVVVAPPPPAPAPVKVEAPPPPAPAPPVAAAAPAPENHRAEVEALTTTALDAFVSNNYPKARKAVDKALALDPKNKKARELQKILVGLG